MKVGAPFELHPQDTWPLPEILRPTKSFDVNLFPFTLF